MKRNNIFSLQTICEKLLIEGVETKNMGLAKHYLYDNFNMDEKSAMKQIGNIKTDIPNSRLAKYKFLLGVTRIYMTHQLDNGQSVMQFNNYLRLIASNAHIEEYDQNLNNLSFQEIDKRFATLAQQEIENDRQDIDSLDFSNTEQAYRIVPIDSSETAAKYGDYTSWCVTHDAGMYYSYTHGGLGRFYFCLRNGFENEQKEKGENCPLDSYGLSMIAVSVNADGGCNTITCRWNHDNKGSDSVMTPKQLSAIIGQNFYNVFKPYAKEEIERKKQDIIQDKFWYVQDAVVDQYDEYLEEFDNDSDYYEDDEQDGLFRNFIENKSDEYTKYLIGEWGEYRNLIIALCAAQDDEYDGAYQDGNAILVDIANQKLFMNELFSDDVNATSRNGDFIYIKGNDNKFRILHMSGQYLTSTKYKKIYKTYMSRNQGCIAVQQLDNSIDLIRFDGKSLFNGKYVNYEPMNDRNNLYFKVYRPINENDYAADIIDYDGNVIMKNIGKTFSINLDCSRKNYQAIGNAETNIIKLYNSDFSLAAPWEIKSLQGYYNSDFYRIVLVNDEMVYLDSDLNICDRQGNILKANNLQKSLEMQESIKRMMKRLDNVKRTWTDYID